MIYQLCAWIMMCCAFAVPLGEKEAEEKDVNSEAPSSLSEATSEKESNSVKSRKDEGHNNSIKKVTEDCLCISEIPSGTVNTWDASKIQLKNRWKLEDIKSWHKYSVCASRSLKMKSQKYLKQQMPQISRKHPTQTTTRRYTKVKIHQPWISMKEKKKQSKCQTLFRPVHDCMCKSFHKGPPSWAGWGGGGGIWRGSHSSVHLCRCHHQHPPIPLSHGQLCTASQVPELRCGGG